MFILLDERAGITMNEDRGAVMLSGTAKECCNAANNGDYGEGCVVADESGIRWDMFASGKWEPGP